jgi:hypothetical protein
MLATFGEHERARDCGGGIVWFEKGGSWDGGHAVSCCLLLKRVTYSCSPLPDFNFTFTGPQASRIISVPLPGWDTRPYLGDSIAAA